MSFIASLVIAVHVSLNIIVGHMCSPNLFDLLVLLTVVTVNDVDRVSLG